MCKQYGRKIIKDQMCGLWKEDTIYPRRGLIYKERYKTEEVHVCHRPAKTFSLENLWFIRGVFKKKRDDLYIFLLVCQNTLTIWGNVVKFIFYIIPKYFAIILR